MRFQLTFQGGGAKIAVLMAAAEAIEELIELNEIEVTNIAGTSAGAIVGAFLAAGIPIAEVRVQLAGSVGEKMLSAYKRPKWYEALFKMIQGKPFWSDHLLRKWLSDHFIKLNAAGPPRISDILNRRLSVVASNLSTGEPERSAPSDDLVSALLNSAGIPFCFRQWNSSNSAVIVDGGLCENLPIDDLVATTATDGRILAFSFQRKSPGNPKNILEFAAALLDVAINRSVQIARDRLGAGSVYTLGTEIGTFDFNSARAYLNSDSYRKDKDAVKVWIRKLVHDAQPKPAGPVTRDYWRSNGDAALLEFMAATGRMYARQHEPQKLYFRAVKFVVTCNCLAESGQVGFGAPDDVFYEVTIAAYQTPVLAHRLTLSTPSDRELFGQYTVRVFDENRRQLPFQILPSITPDSPTDRALIVFFDKPLLPGTGEYTIYVRDLGMDLMAGLRKVGGEDSLNAALPRAQESIRNIHYALHVPDSFRPIGVRRTGIVGSQIFEDGDGLRIVGNPPVGYRTVGIAASEVVDFAKLEVVFSS
jgi:NTE family protein